VIGVEYYLAVLCFTYVVYVTFESLASLARFGGFQVGYMSVGVSLQNQILSANRLLGFFIAPMIGFFADKGGTPTEIFVIGMLGSFIGGSALILVYFRWCELSSFFSKVSCSLVERGYNLKAFFIARHHPYTKPVHRVKKLKLNFFMAQVFTTGLAMPSVFLLNIIAIKVPDYSSTILQMATVVSGFGNLVLNFYTMPLLAVEESNKDAAEIEDTHKAIFIGKITGMLVVSPFILCAHFFI